MYFKLINVFLMVCVMVSVKSINLRLLLAGKNLQGILHGFCVGRKNIFSRVIILAGNRNICNVVYIQSVESALHLSYQTGQPV